MSTTTKRPLEFAHGVARSVLKELRPGCDRIEIAGSIRRRKAEVGDIELVAIPLRAANLFGAGNGNSALDDLLNALVLQGRLKRLKNGDKYKQFVIVQHGIKLDLFLVTPETWGVQLLIRTGPAEFSKRFVTQRSKGGLCPDGFRVQDGRLWDGENAIDTPEEMDVFAKAGVAYVPPENRKDQ